MADKTLTLLIEAQDKASAEIKKISGQVDNLGKKVGGGGLSGILKSAAGVAAGFGLAIGGSEIIGFFKDSISEATQAESAYTKLSHVMKTSVDASDAEIESLKNQASALQNVGVVSEDSVVAAQGMLASFDLQASTIEQLIPSLLDFGVAEQGVNFNTDQATQLATGLGKALQGQTDILKKSGFVFDDHQKKILETGTETERVNMLTEILNSTYGGLNEKMRGTAEGGMVALSFKMNELKEKVGVALMPAVIALGDAFVKLLDKFTPFIEAAAKFAAETVEAVLKAFDETTKGVGYLRDGSDEAKRKFLELGIGSQIMAVQIDLARQVTDDLKTSFGNTAQKSDEASKAMKTHWTDFFWGEVVNVLSHQVPTVIATAMQLLTAPFTQAYIMIVFLVSKIKWFFDGVGREAQAVGRWIRQYIINPLAEALNWLNNIGQKIQSGAASIREAIGFQQGGLVYAQQGFVDRGTDRIPAMLTPGEMVLTREQQGRLFNSLAGREGMGGKSIDVNFNNVTVRSEQDLNYIIDAVRNTLNRDAQLASQGL
jgi:hypothetical protein